MSGSGEAPTSTSETSTDSFKIHDAQSYDTVVDAFDRWTDRFSIEFAERLVALTEPSDSDSVLDVGCGTGVVTRRAARALSGEGRAVGIDLSWEMLARARSRAEEEGLGDQVRFERQDAERLGHRDASFDVVLSLYALLHFPEPAAALAEMKRVLRPGGRLAIGLGSGAPLFSWHGWLERLRRAPELLLTPMGRWANAPQLLDSLVDTVLDERRIAGEPGDGPAAAPRATMYRHRSRDLLRTLEQQGFRDVQVEWLGRRAFFEDVEAFYDVQATFGTHSRKRLQEMSAEERERVRDRFHETCSGILGRGGKLSYSHAAMFLSARG